MRRSNTPVVDGFVLLTGHLTYHTDARRGDEPAELPPDVRVVADHVLHVFVPTVDS